MSDDYDPFEHYDPSEFQPKQENENELHRQSLGGVYSGSAQQPSAGYLGALGQAAANPILAAHLRALALQQAHAANQALAAGYLYGGASSAMPLHHYQGYHSGMGLMAMGAIPSQPSHMVPPARFANPMPPPPIKKTGMRVGEITAWRAWKVDNGFLHSQSAGVIWAPGEPMEGKEGDIKTGLGCFSYKTKRDAIKHGAGEMGGTAVVGSIQIWGRIVEHDIGYRSQFAKIVSLDFIVNAPGRALWRRSAGDEILQQLRTTYGLS